MLRLGVMSGFHKLGSSVIELVNVTFSDILFTDFLFVNCAFLYQDFNFVDEYMLAILYSGQWQFSCIAEI